MEMGHFSMQPSSARTGTHSTWTGRYSLAVTPLTPTHASWRPSVEHPRRRARRGHAPAIRGVARPHPYL